MTDESTANEAMKDALETLDESDPMSREGRAAESIREALAWSDESPDEDHVQRNLNESADKIRLCADVTRGTGTRDQEKHKLKARGETPEEAAENLSEALRELEERDVFERARELGEDDD